jgi:hypothetical protein
MNKFLFSFLLLFGFGSAPTHAQKAEGSSAHSVPVILSSTVEQTALAVNPQFLAPLVDRQSSLLGADGDPFLLQYEGVLAPGNATQIQQIGTGNVTILQQYGGVDNVASISLFGNDNEVTATQNGTGNRLGLAVDGSGNVVPVTQIGVGHELSLEIVGSGVRFDQQTYFPRNGTALLPEGIVQEGNGAIPLHIQIERGN